MGSARSDQERGVSQWTAQSQGRPTVGENNQGVALNYVLI